MNTQNHGQSGAEDDTFRAEFVEALADLLGKIHFRGRNHLAWIAEQIASGLAEESVICRHLMELLPAYDEPEAGPA